MPSPCSHSIRIAFAALAWPLLAICFCEAREEPSFQLEQAAWNATNVVVATSGDEAGVLRVLESWKGDLKQDDALALAGFVLPAELRSIADGFLPAADDAKPARQVTDRRVILFLVKKAIGDGGFQWRAATGVQAGSEFRPFALIVSAVWIVDGKAFAVQQWKNPGPARMLPLRVYSDQKPHELDFDEPQVKVEVQRLAMLQNDLHAAIVIEDQAKRAQALAPLVRAKSWFAWHEGFAALGECGPAAAPVLGEMLADDKLLARHIEIMTRLISLGGEPVAPALVEVVKQELKFWKQTAPQLPKTWRVREGVSPDLADKLQLHSIRLNTALEGLRKHPSPDAAEPVREMRDFWVSLPQLDGNPGRRYVSRLCARVLGAIETAPAKHQLPK